MPQPELLHVTSNHHAVASRSERPRIAIIGAGVTGISCAQALKESGLHATLFEKSRGPGGRLATRRNAVGDQFDHGAQYITSRKPQFTRWLASLRNEGSVATWEPRLADIAGTDHHPWMVGTPAMNALLKPPAAALDICAGITVTALERDGGGWRLLTENGPVPDFFDIVISTAPCPQTHALLAVDCALQAQLNRVTMAPCWALMVTFRSPLAVGFDARRFDVGATAWMARQASRPGHAGNSNAWVLHGSAGWSADHLELGVDEAADMLQKDVARAIGQALPAITFSQAHRWRYALTTQALGTPFLANEGDTLFAAGDWCLGARVECAYESGVTVAHAVAKKYGLA